jgi:hypothetical protein
MFRALLTSMLMAIMAMPQGICFCHFVQAAPIQEARCCHETPDVPAAPVDEQDEHDCDCTLRESLALEASSINSSRDLTPSLDALAQVYQVIHADVASVAVSYSSARSSNDPIPLILCALRI